MYPFRLSLVVPRLSENPGFVGSFERKNRVPGLRNVSRVESRTAKAARLILYRLYQLAGACGCNALRAQALAYLCVLSTPTRFRHT